MKIFRFVARVKNGVVDPGYLGVVHTMKLKVTVIERWIIERSIIDETLMRSASESDGRAVGTPGRRIQIKIMGNISG